MSQEYSFLVEADGGNVNRHKLYDGPDPAGAMAAWSRAISEGREYVMLEAVAVPARVPVTLAEREPGSEVRFDHLRAGGMTLRTPCGHSLVTCHTDRCFRNSERTVPPDVRKEGSS